MPQSEASQRHRLQGWHQKTVSLGEHLVFYHVVAPTHPNSP